MVTRKNDQTWTDIVNWVLNSLIYAEIANISQENADELNSVEHVSIDEIDIALSVKEVGNYGDIYKRNMEEVVPRKGLNLLYSTSEENKSGLLYSHPTGVIDAFRHDFAPDGKINQILDRGNLVCGVLGNEEQSMEVDYCRALAASLFASDSSRVDFVKLSNSDNLMEVLDTGEVDAIAGVTVDFFNDVTPSNETESGLSGLAFSQPYYYPGDQSNIFQKG